MNLFPLLFGTPVVLLNYGSAYLGFMAALWVEDYI